MSGPLTMPVPVLSQQQDPYRTPAMVGIFSAAGPGPDKKTTTSTSPPPPPPPAVTSPLRPLRPKSEQQTPSTPAIAAPPNTAGTSSLTPKKKETMVTYDQNREEEQQSALPADYKPVPHVPHVPSEEGAASYSSVPPVAEISGGSFAF